jgi:hypothetical protein
MYLTHFGRVGDVQRLGRQLLQLLDGMVDLARAAPAGAGRHDAMKQAMLALYTRSLAEHGCTLGADEIEALLAMDLELNAQGLGIWLDSAAD